MSYKEIISGIVWNDNGFGKSFGKLSGSGGVSGCGKCGNGLLVGAFVCESDGFDSGGFTIDDGCRSGGNGGSFSGFVDDCASEDVVGEGIGFRIEEAGVEINDIDVCVVGTVESYRCFVANV